VTGLKIHNSYNSVSELPYSFVDIRFIISMLFTSNGYLGVRFRLSTSMRRAARVEAWHRLRLSVCISTKDVIHT
jgi:hypothetical protein